jgi:nucleoside phosphorylase/hypoxanthine phosphoribosyltransferase
MPPLILIITALPEEYEAVRIAALQASVNSNWGVASWEEKTDGRLIYLQADYKKNGNNIFSVALARPTRMGATATAPLIAALASKLNPFCLAMSGVCAGNPESSALGDVIIAEMVYNYEEGKLNATGFEGDYRQFTMSDEWIRAAQDLDFTSLPSYGSPTPNDACIWLLERLYSGDDPLKHPSRTKYFPRTTWQSRIRSIEKSGFITRDNLRINLTDSGLQYLQNKLFYNNDPPRKLPFSLRVGPVASGNIVNKDGNTWNRLKERGVRTIVGIEMEAVAIASSAYKLNIPEWIVVKGVMDHADSRKDDRYKPFAARASAEVLFRFLEEFFSRVTKLKVLQSDIVSPKLKQESLEITTDPIFTWDRISDASRCIGDMLANTFYPCAVLTYTPRSGIIALLIRDCIDKSIPLFVGMVFHKDEQHSFNPKYFVKVETSKMEVFIPKDILTYCNQNILIVDEYTLTGDSLFILKDFLINQGFTQEKVKTLSLITSAAAIISRKAPDFKAFIIDSAVFTMPWGSAS